MAYSHSPPPSLQGVLRSCSYGGLFHVEQNGRYSLTYSTAEELCMSIGTTLATKEQIQKAFDLGFQTCRYGWIKNHSLVILRQEPYILCAANKTGIIIISDMISQPYDAYCFNASDTKDKNCEFSIMPSSTFQTFLDAHVDNENTAEFTPASPLPEGQPAELPSTTETTQKTTAAIVPPVHVDEDAISHTGQHDDSTTESPNAEQDSETGTVSTTDEDAVSHTGQHDDSTTESPNAEQDSETGTVSTTTSAAIVPPVHVDEDAISHTGQHDDSTTESPNAEQDSETGTVSTTTSAAIVPPVHVDEDAVSHTGQHDDSTTESPNAEQDSETGTVSTTTSAVIVPPVHVDEDKATPIEPTAGDTTANDAQEGDDAGPQVTTQSHHSSTFHISAGEDTSHRGRNG
ncbi:UNVERIFIED_CONTAM: hypothetical protein FKN15_008862 [Acipenser sinensis]